MKKPRYFRSYYAACLLTLFTSSRMFLNLHYQLTVTDSLFYGARNTRCSLVYTDVSPEIPNSLLWFSEFLSCNYVALSERYIVIFMTPSSLLMPLLG